MADESENLTIEYAIEYDAVVVGAGFAGMYMLYKLRNAGFSVRVFEAGSGVGGTWFWNRYPGARCDIDSLEYSYSFSEALQQEWEWTERFAAQPEILRYLNHVADRFDLRPDISLETEVLSATFDDAAARWTVAIDDGTQIRSVIARFVVLASGCLSQARVPSFPGLDSFAGRTLHTSDWPVEGVDFTGQRVGVIGTGSSGVQVTPLIAEQARETVVFQRTPNFTMPARNQPLAADRVAYVKQNYPQLRAAARTTANGTLRHVYDDPASEASPELIRQRYEAGWEHDNKDIIVAFNDLTRVQESNDTLADFLRAKVRSIVHDPTAAAALTAQDYPVGAKRICVGTDYYETFNRDDVVLADLRRYPLDAITPTGIRTTEREFELDVIVFATGFDAMTGAMLRIDIRGRGARSLREDWAAGPYTYLGVASAGYPNLFFITGPGSPSVLSNVVVSIEQHVEWIADHLEYLRKHDLSMSEASAQAQSEWVAHVNEAAGHTLMLKAASWYLGANIPGKPRVFMPYAGGVGVYRTICNSVADDDYRGFALS